MHLRRAKNKPYSLFIKHQFFQYCQGLFTNYNLHQPFLENEQLDLHCCSSPIRLFMKIAAATLNQTPLDWIGNKDRILNAISMARKEGVQVLLFPELSLSGYGCDDYFFMPWVAQMSMDIFMETVVPQSNDMLLAIGMPVRKDGVLYNCLGLAFEGEVLGFYAKQILAGSGVYYEPRWFQPWKANLVQPFEIGNQQVNFGDFTLPFKGIEIGFEICEDAWHSERRPAILGAARKANLILNASASNFARGKQTERHQIVHDLQNRHSGWYLYTNLLGNESGRLIFDGEIIFGKAGKILKTGRRFSMEDVQVMTIDLADDSIQLAKEADDFEQFTAACSLALLDYLRKSKCKGFALSLSGGADSATCAILVYEMIRRAEIELGKDGLEKKLGFPLTGADVKSWCRQLLFCLYQGTQNSGPITRHAAETVAKAIGSRFASWEIDSLVEGYTLLAESVLDHKLDWKTDDLVLQNIQARTRAPGIWILANALGLLLLTTSNRSEGNVGYCTMDGDTAGSLAPIAGVSKHFIRQWLEWAKINLHLPELDCIIQQAPTAELRPQAEKQTDEADLMPYDLLEAIEYQLIYLKNSKEVALEMLSEIRTEPRDYLEKQLSRFVQMWGRSQWKRERLAPSFHLDRFNIDPKSDGRFPILNGL